jgi:tubulin monoglycylase TTLL3/8
MQDLVAHYKEKVNQENAVTYIGETLGMLTERFPQTQINGKNNIWIVKPGQRSRGRGITVHREYDTIVKAIKEGGCRMVVQKYIENPLIINSRKFDIRQWVLVTDWNPLTVWAYNECYIRLAATEYDPQSNSRASHLTNNCVV